MYELIRITRQRRHGAVEVRERTVQPSADLAAVLRLASEKGADAQEVRKDLDEMGCAAFCGYIAIELPKERTEQ